MFVQVFKWSFGLKVNVRIIAATNRNLHEEVAQGKIREDFIIILMYSLLLCHVPGKEGGVFLVS